jgi:hypothetical protein
LLIQPGFSAIVGNAGGRLRRADLEAQYIAGDRMLREMCDVARKLF